MPPRKQPQRKRSATTAPAGPSSRRSRRATGENVAFNDPVHGYIEFEPLLVRIIHTPEFQRMKDIKQLGATYWVYPGASHNRFEHSLGTAYLAGKMIEILGDHTKITAQEVLCVKIAALCHDLGHGPFSHVFDTQMKEKLIKFHRDEETKLLGQEQRDADEEESLRLHQSYLTKLPRWEHEDASCDMFDHMLRMNPGLMDAFEINNIRKKERDLVKQLIKGDIPDPVDGVEYPKKFLFEIVANKKNGIDCDKFDYFARDYLNVGVKSNFDHLRYFQNIRVLPVDGELRLCCRDKLAFNIYEMFHTRWSLHHRVCQHKTTKAIEAMITDAFVLLEDKYHFSRAIFNMKEYAKLTDSIFYEIIRREDEDEKTTNAKKIIRRIQRRDLYKFCGKLTQLPENINAENISALEVANHIASLANISPDDILVSVVKINFGMQDNDPVDFVLFYNKEFQIVPKPQASEMLPRSFSEQYVRVYSKKPENWNAIKAIVTQMNA